MLRLARKQRKIDQLARVFSLELARAQFDANAILPDTYYHDGCRRHANDIYPPWIFSSSCEGNS
jgi:hypothetical protein